MSSGNNCVGCHFEGGHLPLNIPSNGNTLEGCHYYAPRGPVAASVTGSGNKISGITGVGAYGGNPNYVGLYLGGAGNDIDIVDNGTGNGAINFGGSLGNNRVSISGTRSSGVAYVGTPHATDEVSINIGGAAGALIRQDPPISWKAYTSIVTAGSGAFGAVTANAFFSKIGKAVFGRIYIVVTDAGTAGFSVEFTLPSTARAAVGMVDGREGTTGVFVKGWLQTTQKAAFQKASDNSFVGAAGMQIAIGFMYEEL